MKEKMIWQLMAKALSGAADAEELQQLQDFLTENPEFYLSYEYLQNLKLTTGGKSFLTDREIKQCEDKGLEKIEKMLALDFSSEAKTPVSFYRQNRWWFAAAALVMIGLASFFFLSKEKPVPDYSGGPASAMQTFIATHAKAIELKDGTKVWLNKGSSLKCDKGFNKHNREVYLQGEAFFTVVKDAQAPFIVHLKKDVDIKVLGTRFNVKAYPNTPFIETSLLSGKIALDFKDGVKRDLVMKPNEKITIHTDRPEIEIADKDKAPVKTMVHKSRLIPNPIDQKLSETAWMDNRLSFYDMSFEELAYELERYYGKHFVFNSRRLKTWHLTGSFKNETLRQVLDALRITTPFNYEIVGEKVILNNNPKN